MTRLTVTVRSLRLGAFREDPARQEAIECIQSWTRGHFDLADGSTVLVTELVSSIPGCPPLETVVAFWLEDGQRHHFKVSKPLEKVTSNDLPPAWLKDALCAEAGDRFTCC